MWGIGSQWAAWLKEQGITTALDLKRADPKAIRARMTVVGERIVSELNGEPCLGLELVPPPQKGITVSRSFGRLLTDPAAIRQALLQFVGRAGEKLRRQSLQAKRLTVFLMTSPFADRPFYSNSMTANSCFQPTTRRILSRRPQQSLRRFTAPATPTRNAASCSPIWFRQRAAATTYSMTATGKSNRG